jgi:hypothetical protein
MPQATSAQLESQDDQPALADVHIAAAAETIALAIRGARIKNATISNSAGSPWMFRTACLPRRRYHAAVR